VFGAPGEEQMLRCVLFALVLIPMLALARLAQSSARGLGHVVLSQVPEFLIRHLVFLALVVGLYVFLRGPGTGLTTVFLQIAATVCAVGFALMVLRRALPPEALEATPRMRVGAWLGSAVPFLLISVMQVINKQADTIMLGAIQSAQEVGIYRIASRAAFLLIFPLSCTNAALAPTIARLHERGEKSRLQKLVSLAACAVFGAAFVGWLVFVLLGRQLLGLLNPDYRAGYPVLLILGSGLLVCCVASSVGVLLMMTDHEKNATGAIGVAALLNIALNAILIPRYSYIGAACATATSTLVMNAILIVSVLRTLHIDPTFLGVFRRGDD
jgi:O-antigen/teichoic acid export membrane protein